MKDIIKRFYDGDIDVKYNNFDNEKRFEAEIISREVSKNIEETKNIIKDYIKEHNIKDFELYYNKSYDALLISYNI